jgi:hypothetical protein
LSGLAAHPSGRLDVNSNHFKLAMLAYNLNCWLMLLNRDPQADATALRHTTLATSRHRFVRRQLFLRIDDNYFSRSTAITF